jgi:hypothetical protein
MSMRFALFAISLYLRLPLLRRDRALMYAASRPFLLIRQVFLAQIGKDFLGPKKHFGPHFFIIRVRWWVLGALFAHPFTLWGVCLFVLVLWDFLILLLRVLRL